MGTVDDESRLSVFIDKALHLPRADYLALIACCRAFCDSLVVASYNLHLAYSMLVYVLDSLSQQFGEFEPRWTDFQEDARTKIDEVLSRLDPGQADDVRNVLIATQHIKIRTRFVEYVKEHVGDSFFVDECPPSPLALRASDMTHALRTLYDTRSGFVHELAPLRDQICIPQIAAGDVFHWEHLPYLTYGGLVRLVRHVLLAFVEDGESLDAEEYAWEEDLPGRVLLMVAPKYWVWKADGLGCATARHRLCGFLEYLNEVITSDSPIADMRDVLQKCQELIPTADRDAKRAMLVLLVVVNHCVKEELQTPGWKECVQRHEDAFDDCCIESLLLAILTGQDWPWSASQCAETVCRYFDNRHRKASLSLPRQQERGLMLGVHNRFISEGSVQEAREWAHRAILDSGGLPEVQSMIREAATGSEPYDLRAVMWGDAYHERGSVAE